jgi:hypothetical protein
MLREFLLKRTAISGFVEFSQNCEYFEKTYNGTLFKNKMGFLYPSIFIDGYKKQKYKELLVKFYLLE